MIARLFFLLVFCLAGSLGAIAGSIKADGNISFAVGAPVLDGGRNIASLEKMGTGQIRIHLATPFYDTSYSVAATAESSTEIATSPDGTKTSSSFDVWLRTANTFAFVDVGFSVQVTGRLVGEPHYVFLLAGQSNALNMGAMPAFVSALEARRGGVTAEVVNSAVSGSAIADWAPGQTNLNAAIAGANAAITATTNSVFGGLIWYQGETEAQSGPVSGYAEQFVALVAAVRSGISDAPTFVVELQEKPNAAFPDWDVLQFIQRNPETDDTHTVSAADLPSNGDVHLPAALLDALARRLANAAAVSLP